MTLLDPTWAWEGLGDAALTHAAEIAAEQAGGVVDEVRKAALRTFRSAWAKMNWKRASSTYQHNLFSDLSRTKILGNTKDIQIEKIYTDVYVHGKSAAAKIFTDDEAALNRLAIELPSARTPALVHVNTSQNLFILGRPGAGKTTFLKFLAIQCCRGEIAKTPIFVVLKDWADSGTDLISFITRGFEVCGFPKSEAFVRALLVRGSVLVLLDGLDEVNEEHDLRRNTINKIVEFSKQYRNNQFCITCRTATTDYSFDNFSYVEVADFSPDQQRSFVTQWYGDDSERLKRFVSGWEDAAQSGLRQLGRTPLLLTLLCLAFDDTLQFPTRQVDLYRDAVDALLRKWDSSRLIVRDRFYKSLSPTRRESLLETIACHFFLEAKVAFRLKDLERVVSRYFESLPDLNRVEELDAEQVIRQLESQHGLIVERAANIFSFSHLTIQEYLTAAHLVKSRDEKILAQIGAHAIKSQTWREVLLFIAGLAPDVDPLMEILQKQIGLLQAGSQAVFRFCLLVKCDVLASKRVSGGFDFLAGPFLINSRYEPAEFALKIRERARVSPSTSNWTQAVARELVGVKASLSRTLRFYEGSMLLDLINQSLHFIDTDPESAARVLTPMNDEALRFFYGARLLVECLEMGLSKNRLQHTHQIFGLDERLIDICAQDLGVQGC